MSVKPTTKPDWVSSGDPTKVIEPSAGKKTTGWLALEKPPFQYFNYLFYILSKWLNYFDGGHKYTYVIDTDTDIGDYTTLAGYVADSPAAGDKVLVRVSQVLSATLDIPAGVEITLAKGVVLSTTTVFTPVLRFADDCKSVGELVLSTGHTGTIADAFVVNGNDNHHENVLVKNTSTGTLTDAITVIAGKLRNYVNGAVVNSGGGTVTNVLNDASSNITNQVKVRDAARQYGFEPHHHDGLAASIPYALDTGAADVYAIALSPALTAYAAGQVFWFKATNVNTGASTLNVNTLGAKAIKRLDGSALVAGDIQNNGFYGVIYDGTNVVLINSNHGHSGAADGGAMGVALATSLKVSGAAPSPPIADTLYRENIVGAWINFDGTGTIAINDSYNVSSIVDEGVGDYTINWDLDFANINYGLAGMGSEDTGLDTFVSQSEGDIAVGSVRVRITTSDALVDRANVHVIAIGDQ